MRQTLLLLCMLLLAGADTLAQRAPDRSDKQRRTHVPEPLPDPFTIEPEPPSTTAMFPGNFQLWLERNLQYPDSAAQSGSEGTAFVQFIVNLDGSVEYVRLARSSGSTVLDREALRVAKLMPAWLPATVWGRPVRSVHKIKINFRQHY